MSMTILTPPANLPAALCDAVRANDMATVRRLLAAGADPNAPDPTFGMDNAPALHDAATTGECAMIALLLKAGADVNACSESGWTALIRACNAGWLDAARLLLDAGADPNARNAEGYSAWGRIPGGSSELSALLAERGGAGPR